MAGLARQRQLTVGVRSAYAKANPTLPSKQRRHNREKELRGEIDQDDI